MAVSRATPIPHFDRLGIVCGLLYGRFDVGSVRANSGGKEGELYGGMTGGIGEREPGTLRVCDAHRLRVCRLM